MLRIARIHLVPILVVVLLAAGSLPAAAFEELFVSTTTYEITGSCSRMELSPPFASSNDLYTIHSDAVMRSYKQWVFVVNRFLGDNILVLDAADGYSIVNQYSVGNGSNPHDLLCMSEELAYITLYDTDELLAVHPLTGQEYYRISLAELSDADGIPEMDQMAQVGELLFVSLQHIDRPGGWISAGTSQLAVVDTRTGELLDADPDTPGIDGIPLQFQNPTWKLDFHPGLRRILAVCSGDYLSADGGVEIINPYSLESEGALIGEAALGGDLLDAVYQSPTRGFAIINDSSFNTHLVSFDPSTGSKLSTLWSTEGFLLSDLELSSTGRLYLGDRSPSNPGIRVFDTDTSSQITSSPVNVGLPPFDMALIEGLATASEIQPVVEALQLRAWPNPFNPSVEIRWNVPRQTLPPALEILDVRGRRICTLSPVDEEGSYRWNGTNDDGESVASGVYRAHAIDGKGGSIALTLLR